MSTDAALQKQALRRELRRVLRAISPEARQAASERAWRLLDTQTAWQQARTVFLYWSLSSELGTGLMIESALRDHKTVALPRFNRAAGAYELAQVMDLAADLRPGQLGILEPHHQCPPVEPIRLDFSLVPGLGFGPDGRRLGRGKGFYDRMLAHVGGLKCGAAFDEQIVEGIPREPHDICVDCLLTPARWWVVNPRPVLE
jgi:5-formyltetrahydrofolate cyclo-ligase